MQPRDRIIHSASGRPGRILFTAVRGKTYIASDGSVIFLTGPEPPEAGIEFDDAPTVQESFPLSELEPE